MQRASGWWGIAGAAGFVERCHSSSVVTVNRNLEKERHTGSDKGLSKQHQLRCVIACETLAPSTWSGTRGDFPVWYSQ